MSNTIKKQSDDLYQQTELGILPRDWQIKKIGELFNVQQGISMSPGRREGPNKYPFLRTLNVFWRGIDLTTLDYMVFSEKEIEKLNLLPGDLLVCEGGDIGRTAMWRGELETCGYQNHLHRLRVKSNDVNPEFVMFWMQAAMEILGYYREEGNKTTIPNLSQSRLKNFDIPLPPLPEQHTIATTLRTVQEAKEKTDAVIAATKALKAAMMKHLFTYGPVPPEDAERVALKETESGQVPEGWECVNLEMILKVPVRNGYALNRSNAKGEVRTYTLTAITKNNFSEKYVKNIGVDPSKIENYWLTPGDIYIARANTPEYVGLAALYQGKEKYAIFTDLFVRISVDETKVDPKFLLEFLRMPICRQYYQSRLKHTAGNFPKIDQHIINATKVILPPIAEQKTISGIIEIIDQKLAAEQSRKEALDTLFTSLLHNLMTAKIRVNQIAV